MNTVSLLRARRVQLVRRLGEELQRRREHRAIVPAEFAEFGENSSIELPSRIVGREFMTIGDNVAIARYAFLSAVSEHNGVAYTPDLRIGSGSRFGHSLFISCCGQIVIGRDVLASDRVFIGDSYHDYRDPTVAPIHQPLAPPRSVTIGDGVFLGVGCCVLQGVTLGSMSYVAANAVVTADVPERSIVAGNPARVIKRWTSGRWAPVANPTLPVSDANDRP